MPCLSPVVARHFGKRCVAPIAPVKWHKPEAMLLRLGVRERAAVELETHSHSAAVSESQSTEHTPNNLMEMLFTVQEGTRSFTHSGNRWKSPEYVRVWVQAWVRLVHVQLWIIKCPLYCCVRQGNQDIWSGTLFMARDVTPLLMQRCSVCARSCTGACVLRWAFASSVV